MRFVIDSVNDYGDADELLADFPCLQQFGIEIEKGECYDTVYIQLEDMDRLKELASAIGYPLIIDGDFDSIRIYDGYME